MSKFKLSDLGDSLRDYLTTNHSNVYRINWELVDYDLKRDIIKGELVIAYDADGTNPFSSARLALKLSDMLVECTSNRKTHTKRKNSDGYYYVNVIDTYVSLKDFPALALTNFIADRQEVLEYDWYV